MLQRGKAFGAQAGQRIDRTRAVRAIERGVPDLHQHAQFRVVAGALQALQIDLRVIAQRKRNLTQLFVEQCIDLAAGRRVRCDRRDDSCAEQSAEQCDKQPAPYRRSAHQSSV
jgi:hypothetical protein